jgi:hypothetical protein
MYDYDCMTMTVCLWLYDYHYDCMTVWLYDCMTVWLYDYDYITVWLWLYDYECMTMTVMTENKLETNQQEQEQQVEKWYLEPPFAVKKSKNCH